MCNHSRERELVQRSRAGVGGSSLWVIFISSNTGEDTQAANLPAWLALVKVTFLNQRNGALDSGALCIFCEVQIVGLLLGPQLVPVIVLY